MFQWLLVLACTVAPADPLGDEGRAAAAALAQALVGQDPVVVAPAARAAATWEGADPGLDRLLGNALANVLMKPEQGLPLLRAHPAPGDPDWVRATLDAAMRTGNPATITAVWAELGRPALAADHPVVQQVVQRVRRDPGLHHDLLEDVTARCTLLDRQPQVGRKALDLPAMPELVAAAQALGATGVVLGRAARRSDPDPATGAGPWRCGRAVLLDTAWPEPMPRSLVIGAQDGQTSVFLDIKIEGGHPWAYAASDADIGARWLQAATLFRDAGGGEAGRARVRAALGQGLRAP